MPLTQVKGSVLTAAEVIAKAETGVNQLWQGHFPIWQRGISFDTFASRSAVADGWTYARSSFAADSTVSQQAGTNSTYSCRVQRDNATSGTESLNLVCNLPRSLSLQLAGETLTLRVRAKAGGDYSAASGNLFATLRSTTHTSEQSITLASGQYSTGDVAVGTLTMALTTGLQSFEETFSVAADVTQLSVRLQAVPVGTAGANDWFEVEDIMLVVGSEVIDSTEPNAEQSLIRAQEQYFTTYPANSTPGSIQPLGALGAIALGSSSDSAFSIPVVMPTPMRAAPTVTVYNPATGASGTVRNTTDSSDVSATVSNIGTGSFNIEPSSVGDTYVEGTWSPAFGAVSVSYTSQTGRYTRIGNLCYFELEIDYTSLNTADTSDIQVSLPFTAANNGFGSVTINLSHSTGATFAGGNAVHASLSSAASLITLSDANGTNWDYNDGKLAASGTLMLAGVYLVSEATGTKSYTAHVTAESIL
jgi:hypothetical protein